jgi:hypothetical protein
MDWDEVTTVDDLNKYIEEHVGWENVYDELYQDFLYGMIRNRESKRRLEKLIRDADSDSIIIHP